MPDWRVETAPVGNESARADHIDRKAGENQPPLPAAPWTSSVGPQQQNSTNAASAAKADQRRPPPSRPGKCEVVGGADQRSPCPHTATVGPNPLAVHLSYRERLCKWPAMNRKDRSVVEAPQEPAILGPSERACGENSVELPSMPSSDKRYIRAGQDQPWPSALCREGPSQERGVAIKRQPAAPKRRGCGGSSSKFPIGVMVGVCQRRENSRSIKRPVPRQFQHLRFRGESQAIQTDLLRKLIEASPPQS